MNLKLLVRGFVILVLLFIVLYVGMNNTHSIDFFFPLLLEKKISQPAALLFFGMFAIGVVAGMMLNADKGKTPDDSAPRKKK
jgi:uncharacterized integral membrane protein